MIFKNHNSPIDCKIMILSPALLNIFLDDKRLLDSKDYYSSCAQIKTIIYQRRAVTIFNTLNLSKIQLQGTESDLFHMVGAASYFYQIFKFFEEFFWIENDQVNSTSDKDFTLERILKPIFDRRYCGVQYKPGFLQTRLINYHNKKLVRKLKNRKKLLVIDNFRNTSKNFIKAACEINQTLAIIAPKAPVKSFVKALKVISKSKQKYVYFFPLAENRNFETYVDQLIDKADYKFLKTCFTIAKPHLAHLLTLADSIDKANQLHINNLSPDIVISDVMHTPFTISAAKYARRTVSFNHASHTPQYDPISKTIGDLWASLGYIYNENSDICAARSPAVAALIKEIYPTANVVPLRHDEALKPKPHAKTFTILYAGNFLRIERHVPWSAETADEFIAGIIQLAAAVEELTAEGIDILLKIRIKPRKTEFSHELMKKIMAAYSHTIISTTASFKDDLNEADLVAANISSTIDEALQSGRPVLLHTYRKNYRHLPAMQSPPTENARSAVYATSANLPITDLLRSIIKAHHLKPLSANELAPYIWPQDTADMHSFAQSLLENASIKP